MTFTKIFVFFFISVISSSTILAQESTEPSSSEPINSQNAPTLPFGSGIFDHFPLRPPNFDLHALWPHLAVAGLTPRHKRAIEDSSEINDHPRVKRRVISCNFLTQGGFRCTSCNTVRRCYPFNLGKITTCGGIFPYCNNGVCSRIKGSLCSLTTSPLTSTSTSTSTPTSKTTSTSTFTPTSTPTSTSTSTLTSTSTSTPTSTSTSTPTSTSTSTSTFTPTSTSTSTLTSTSTSTPTSTSTSTPTSTSTSTSTFTPTSTPTST